MLDTTRAYAIEKLHESDERELIARRHAEYYRALLENALSGTGAGNFATGFAAEISNIRAALVWAFSEGGDPTIAVAVASASAQLWLELSLLAECHNWTSKALAWLSDEERVHAAKWCCRRHSGYPSGLRPGYLMPSIRVGPVG